MARAKGEGTFERRKADGWVRHVRQSELQRIVGPFKPTKSAALAAWREKVAALESENARKEREDDAPNHVLVGDEIYWCLFGVWGTPDGSRPKSKGIWADELAPTTYQLYIDAFKSHIRHDPIAEMRPKEVDRDDVLAFRTRLLRARSSYERGTVATDADGRKVAGTETVTRKPISPRTVKRYMEPVNKVLARNGNKCYLELKPMKMPAPKKSWLSRSDRDAFLALMPSEYFRRAALLMMHGMCIGEVCAITHEAFDGERLRIEEQISQIDGKAVLRRELKRERRYRWVPVHPDLAKSLEGVTGRLVPMSPQYVRKRLKIYTADTKFEAINPHDLRRSGGKWMLDAGAKLSDVAAILGNDPRTLLMWYDTADEAGKAKAILAV